MTGWRCTKCGTISGGVNKPLVGGCRKGGGHSWSEYGNVSTQPQAWYCEKCGAITSWQSKPMDAKCFKGGNHDWCKRN